MAIIYNFDANLILELELDELAQHISQMCLPIYDFNGGIMFTRIQSFDFSNSDYCYIIYS